MSLIHPLFVAAVARARAEHRDAGLVGSDDELCTCGHRFVYAPESPVLARIDAHVNEAIAEAVLAQLADNRVTEPLEALLTHDGTVELPARLGDSRRRLRSFTVPVVLRVDGQYRPPLHLRVHAVTPDAARARANEWLTAELDRRDGEGGPDVQWLAGVPQEASP